jgi:hypothetical protein
MKLLILYKANIYTFARAIMIYKINKLDIGYQFLNIKYFQPL